MGIRKFISNLFAPDEEKKKKPAGTTSQASAASTGTRAVGKTVVKTPTTSTTEKKTETKTKKSGTSTKKSDTAKAKSETKKSTDSRRTVAVGKATVKLPTEQQKKDAKSPISEAWNKRKETVAQKQVQQVQGRQSKTVSNPGILDKWNSAQKERNAARQAEEQAQKNRQNQMQLLSDAAGSYEARLKAIADRASRAPESITQEDVDAYNDLWTRYQQTLGNYAKAKGEQDAEEQLRKTQKKSAQQQILAAMGAGDTMQGETGQQNNTIFDVDPRQQIINAQIAGQGAQAAAQQRAQQLPKTLAAIGLGGVAAAQDTVGTAMGMGEQAAWALSPGAQQDAAQRADHARQTAAWQQENRDAQKKMEKAFALTEDDALGQFLVELNYNFVQQGISTVAGGIFGKAGGTALSALGKEASAAGGNLAGRIGSQAAQRAAATAQMSGKALQGAARYLQKNAPLATMATLAGANNYQAAIGGGADEGQAMAYAVLTGAAEAVTEKLFGGNPLMDNEAGWVNRALYKMLGDRKFLKALDSVPVETFNEGFEEVIANYLYSAAQAATGQQVELPSAEENLHSFALGAALGGVGQAAKLAGNAMRQRSADIETGELMQRMGAGNELIAAGLALPGSRAEMHATELRLRNQQPTAWELGRQYRENVRAQQAAQQQRTEQENTIRRMADAVGTRVVFDETIRDAAGNESAANGYYKDGVLHISRDADKPAMIVAKHEITHYLQQAAPEEYRAFRTLAMSLQEEGSVPQMMERYARGGVTLTEEKAMDEIAANLAEQLMSDRGSIESLIRENPSVAQRFFDALREFIRKLAGRVDPQLRQAEKLWTEAYQAAKGRKNAAPEDGKAQYLYKGKDAETGKSIYESNFPKGTPKAAKSKHILNLVQNVWSKKPITMYVEDEATGMPRMIEAQFDPTYSEEEGVETDARKLAGGNKIGSAKERRVTMDLADDYYRIAQEADYDHSSPEEGKLIATHEGVKTWHYFADQILFQEQGETKKDPYRVVVNIKEKPDGEFVYSFTAFDQKKKGQAPGSVQLPPLPARSASNAQPSNSTIAQQAEKSKKKFSLKEASADKGYWDDLSYRRYDESSPMSRAGYAMMADDAYSVETYGEKLVAVRQSELRPISEFQDKIAEAWERDKENGALPYELEFYNSDRSGEEVAAAFDPEDIVMSADAWDNEDMVMWAYEKVFDGVPGVKTRDGAIVFDENLLHRLDTDSDVLGSELHNQPKYALKKDGEDLKTMRAERTDVRREIDKLEWLEEKQGYLDETDAAAMKQLRAREKDLTERIDVANAAAKENRGTEAERIMQKAKGEAAAAQPTQAGKTLRQDLLDTFSVQAGKRKELGRAIDRVAARVREQGYATASDGAELFRGLYNAGVVVDTTESEHYAEIRRTLRGVKLHIDETVRAELGDDFNRTRQEAFRNGIILTTKNGEGVGIDVEHKEMAELFPGVFDNYNTDRTAQLEDMIHAAELGRPEHISLMEQAMRAGGEDAVAQQMTFFDRYLTNALENYAKQAGFEMRVKQGEIMKAAKARAIAADAWEKQSQRKALAEAQNRTLKVFQRLRRMKKDQSAETKALIDEIVGDFDTMAKTLRKNKEATWRDLRKIYDAEREKDPNFLPNESWEQKFSRLDAARVGELSREEALELYQRGVELIHMIRTKDKEIAAENARNLEDLYRNSVHEIRTSDGNIHEYSKGEKGKEKIKGAARRYWNEEQLSPLNMIEKMGGWRRDGAFYSMAKQLERGEYDKQRYIIQSDALLKEFTEKHEKWIAKADGKGKDAIWYEIDAPAFLEAGNGGADLRENKSVKIYMTPMMKVKLYLDSLNYDNLRHINFGGATFPDKQLYAAGNEKAAYARGVTVKMQPGFVKSLVADLTPEEKELAFILGTKYFNGYAKEEINRVSNLLEGHDKAMNSNYSPIYTNANFLGKKADPAIVDATIEGMGPLKNRVWSGKPMLAVSALSAFQKHRDMTAKYVGLAIPVRNMNTLLNYTEKGYHDSMREVISKKWGANSVEYLDNLLVNLQNRPAAEINILDDLVNGALNNYVKAVFGFNPGTVIKQAPGFFMAGARLGFDTIPATSMLHSAWGKYRNLMAKYTPLMEWRARGYSTREMAELKNNPSWTQRNRAFKFVFGGAIQWMDLHTCAAIWPWAENYVKKHYPNLKPGSRSEVNSGKDAYYKKVAEVFEDAIASSQPMYDDMHTAQILHNNKSVARGITMFHTAQLTQANAIRQAHGEMKRAQAENDKEGLKRGQKAFKDSIMALLISTLSFEAVGALVAIAKRKDKALRDDEGEMTPATIAKYMADATAKDLLGNVVGWDTAYDIGTHVLFGNTWYGFEMPGADAIQDFIDDAAKWKKAAAEFGGGIFNVTDAGDFQYYLRTAGSDFRKASKNVAVDLSYLLGVPAKNMESYTLGLLGWINPDLAAAYNNAWGGSYDKSSVATLGGKPKEQEAAIRKAVRNRAKDASDEAVAELQRLYQTAGTEVLPQAVADTITIKTGEDSSEKVELNLKQKSDYQKAYDKVASAELNQLIASPEYAKLSDDQKAGAVVLLYQYAAEQGKQAAVAEYAPKGWKDKAASAAEEGADVYQTVIYKAATEEIEGDKGEDGKTIDGSKNKKLFYALDTMNFTAEQKAAIYKASVDDFTEDSGYADAKAAGVSDWQYAAFKANTGTIKSDKDEDGKTITGSKKGKVMDYINKLDISNEAKDALYYAAGYTESKIGEAPWRGGTTGTKKSSGKGRKKSSSGSSKKAQKAAKKQTAARAALATPEMQNYLQKYGLTQANGRPATAADLQSSVERYIRKYTGGRSLPRAGETMNLPSDLPRAGEALTTRDLPRAGEEVQMQSLPTYNDLVNRREKESLDEKYFRKFGRR